MKKLATLAVLVAVAFPSCSLVVEANGEQCANDAECTSRGAGFEGTFCNEQSVCQNNLEFCSTNAQCIDRTGVNSYICRRDTNRCVNLITQECPKLLADPDDLRNGNPFILGSLGLPSTAPPFLAAENALEMARKEFADTSQGVPNSSPPRPAVIIACDISLESSDEYQKVTDHLTDEVGVSVIFGPQPPAWGPYVLQKATEKGAAVLTFGYSTELDPGLNRRGILFRTGYDRADLPLSTSALINEAIEPKIRAARPPAEGQAPAPLKVAILYTDLGLQVSNIATLVNGLTFNGKSAAQNGANFRQISYASIDDPDFESKFATAIIEATEFQPDVVLLPLGGNEVADALVRFEQRLPDYAHFITSSAVAVPQTLQFAATAPTLRTRLWVQQSAQSPADPNFFTFALTYSGAFLGGALPSPEIATGAAAAYDLFYFAMYAAAAVGNQPPTGPAIGNALLTRLRSGTPTKLGPSGITSAAQKLSLNENIVVTGALTSSQFDDQGDTSPPIQVLCLTGDMMDPIGLSGLYYDKLEKQLKGTNTCF